MTSALTASWAAADLASPIRQVRRRHDVRGQRLKLAGAIGGLGRDPRYVNGPRRVLGMAGGGDHQAIDLGGRRVVGVAGFEPVEPKRGQDHALDQGRCEVPTRASVRPVGDRPAERARVVAAGLGDRKGGGDAQALRAQLLPLSEADGEHPSIVARPKQGQLAKRGAHVVGAATDRRSSGSPSSSTSPQASRSAPISPSGSPVTSTRTVGESRWHRASTDRRPRQRSLALAGHPTRLRPPDLEERPRLRCRSQ